MSITQHVLTAPIYGLVLGKPVSDEIRVGRVTFIGAKKIPRVRKRLGIKHPISHYRKRLNDTNRTLFTNASTYAVLVSPRELSDKILSKEFKEIQDSFWLLASSFAFRKRANSAMALRPHADTQSLRDIAIFDRASDGCRLNVKFNDGVRHDFCDEFWVKNAKRGHFFALQKILDGKSNATEGWIRSLTRAAKLLGQSYVAKHLAEAFTYNMIGLETLLCSRNDKHKDALVTRLIAIFGWLHNEDRKPWEESVNRLYELRCKYVHDGVSDDITGMDLHVSETILKNLLRNFCKNSHVIKEKEDVIAIANRYAACETLSKNPKRPCVFYYQQTSLTPEIIAEINDTQIWEW